MISRLKLCMTLTVLPGMGALGSSQQDGNRPKA